MASKAETFRTKKSANGFVLSDHEHEKSELINMTKNCEKSQVTKNRQTYGFSQFSQILLNPQLALNFSDYWHDKELRKIVRLAIFRNTRKIALLAAACKPGYKRQMMWRTYYALLSSDGSNKAPVPRKLFHSNAVTIF